MPIYLKLGKIDGDATASDHTKWINISSMQFGAGRAISMQVGSAAAREASAPSLSEVSLSKELDRSSYMLFTEAVSGKGTDAKIHFVRSEGNELQMYLEYTLENAMVSSYSLSSGGDQPSESISLSYTKIEMRLFPTKVGGGLDAAVTAGYDLKEGKKI